MSQLTWLKDSKKIITLNKLWAQSTNVHIIEQLRDRASILPNNGDIVIHNVEHEDEGIYECLFSYQMEHEAYSLKIYGTCLSHQSVGSSSILVTDIYKGWSKSRHITTDTSNVHLTGYLEHIIDNAIACQSIYDNHQHPIIDLTVTAAASSSQCRNNVKKHTVPQYYVAMNVGRLLFIAG